MNDIIEMGKKWVGGIGALAIGAGVLLGNLGMTQLSGITSMLTEGVVGIIVGLFVLLLGLAVLMSNKKCI